MDIIQHVWILSLSLLSCLYPTSFTFLDLGFRLRSILVFILLVGLACPTPLQLCEKPGFSRCESPPPFTPFSPFKPAFSPPLVFILTALNFKGALLPQDTNILILGCEHVCLCLPPMVSHIHVRCHSFCRC